jgi:Bifunctional DNA primase/polymerase, N-terminal
VNALAAADLRHAARGWRVLLCRPQGKEPLVRRGVHDATTDPQQLARWRRRWPNANTAIACGLPGPQVGDIDDVGRARHLIAALRRAGVPEVATARGPHFYFGGQRRGTIALDFGELRGTGSYVVAPPSIHPSGKEYTWLLEPRGLLPAVPAMVTGTATTAGCGDHRPPAELVPYRHRHPYLRDFCVRLLRAGITDQGDIAAHLRLEFDRRCVPQPPPKPGYFEAYALWATRTRIAARERRG